MKRKNKFLLFALTAVLGLISSVGILSSKRVSSVETEAAFTSDTVRIAVVRPDWWGTASAVQYLRVAPTAADLDANTNVTNYSIESWTGDSYYKNKDGDGNAFQDYHTDGVVFYDIPYAASIGKYVDLVRWTSDLVTRWNKTPSELFTDSMLHKIWRIWGDGNGVHRPSGNEAESRVVSNPVVSSLLFGYLSCSSNYHNGYKAYSALNDHFNLEGHVFTAEDTVLDFTSEADYVAGRGEGKTVYTADKIAMMKAMYDANPSSSNYIISGTNHSITIIILISIIGITSLAALYFLRKKKVA